MPEDRTAELEEGVARERGTIHEERMLDSQYPQRGKILI
jgi:hypothetical protein